MEIPYLGRATIQDNLSSLQIVIPAKKNWFLILFIGAWLGGWLIGEVFATGVVTGLLHSNPAGLFILFWLIAWMAGVFFALRIFLWNLKGQEIIIVRQGTLSIEKKDVI